jgi:hypothetical protein
MDTIFFRENRKGCHKISISNSRKLSHKIMMYSLFFFFSFSQIFLAEECCLPKKSRALIVGQSALDGARS